MATIQTALTISANKSTATTTPGPMSVAISTAATASLTVDKTTSETVTTASSFTDGDAAILLIDGSNYTPGTGGTNGGYVYMKNITASGTDLIYIGVEANGNLTDLAPSADAQRLFTLKRGEWAFFPFDYTMDITIDASAASQKFEYWIFDRG